MEKLIIGSNPVNVFSEFENAIKQGYRFVENKSDVTEWSTGMLQLDVYSVDQLDTVDYNKEVTVFISERDKYDFVKKFQQLVIQGYSPDYGSLNYNFMHFKTCEFVNLDHPSNIKYTREQLENMSYEELKEVGKSLDCFNRSREVMTQAILKTNGEN